MQSSLELSHKMCSEEFCLFVQIGNFYNVGLYNQELWNLFKKNFPILIKPIFQSN